LNCTDKLAGLEVSTHGYLDVDSQGCHIFHATLAEQIPVKHCAHIAINPTADPFGAVKCHASIFSQPEAFFKAEELELFDEFANLHNIDLAIGYTEKIYFEPPF